MKISRRAIRQLIREEFKKWHQGVDDKNLASRFNHEQLVDAAANMDPLGVGSSSSGHSICLLKMPHDVGGEILSDGFYVVEESDAFESRAIAGPFDDYRQAVEWSSGKVSSEIREHGEHGHVTTDYGSDEFFGETFKTNMEAFLETIFDSVEIAPLRFDVGDLKWHATKDERKYQIAARGTWGDVVVVREILPTKWEGFTTLAEPEQYTFDELKQTYSTVRESFTSMRAEKPTDSVSKEDLEGAMAGMAKQLGDALSGEEDKEPPPDKSTGTREGLPLSIYEDYLRLKERR